VGESLALSGGDVAPTDDLVILEGDELRNIVGYIPQHESSDGLKGRRLDESQVQPLAGYRIQAALVSGDMLFGDRHDVDSLTMPIGHLNPLSAVTMACRVNATFGDGDVQSHVAISSDAARKAVVSRETII
jgi:hypothetical protein